MRGLGAYLLAIVLGVVGVVCVVSAMTTGLGSEGFLAVGSALLAVAATRAVDEASERRKTAVAGRDSRRRELNEARRAAYVLRTTLAAATPDKVQPVIAAVATLTNYLATYMPLERAAHRGQELFNGAMAGSGKDDLETLIEELTARNEAI